MSRTFSFISLEDLTDNSSITTIDSLESAATSKKRKKSKRKPCLTLRGEQRRNELENNKRLASDNIRKKNERDNENEQERIDRLAQQTNRSANNRYYETEQQKIDRLAQKRIQTSNNRELETEEQRIERLRQQAIRTANYRSNETDEQREARLLANKLRAQRYRANETVEQREARLEADRIRHATAHANETPQERLERLNLARATREAADVERTRDTYQKAAIPRGAIYDEKFVQHDLGEMDQVCPHCNALYWRSEVNSAKVFTKCCRSGQVNVPIPIAHPTIANLLLPGENEHSLHEIERTHFLENIRQYNHILAFAGVKTQFDPQNYDNRRNRSCYLYKCHGAMYFNFPPIFNDPDDTHRLQTAQFYILDSDEANRQRRRAWREDNGRLNRQVINLLLDF